MICLLVAVIFSHVLLYFVIMSMTCGVIHTWKPCDIKLCCMDDVRKAMWYMIFCFVLSVNSWFSVWVAFVVLVSVCGGCIWNSVLVQQFILVRIENVAYIVFNVFNF